MKESKKFTIAQFASGCDYPVEEYYEYAGGQIFNLQLRYWVEALQKFTNLDPDNFKKEELILILDCLCNSLATLAGVNIKPKKKDYTPSLLELFKKTLKEQKGWDLKLEKPELLEELEEMREYHNNVCKHLNKSQSRKDLIGCIDYQRICKYMNTTQNIWLWVLGKRFRNKIPKEQRRFFDYDFSWRL